MNMLVKMSDQALVEDLRKVFFDIDTDQCGVIHASDLKHACTHSTSKFSDDQIDKII